MTSKPYVHRPPTNKSSKSKVDLAFSKSQQRKVKKMTGTAIKTNGIGKVTTSHLNLTRTIGPSPYVYRNKFSHKRVIERHQKRELRNAGKVKYAGSEVSP